MSVFWAPQPGPQTNLITCPVFEVFFGGSRGGGKTEGFLGDWMAHVTEYPRDARGLMIRKNRVQLIDMIARSKQLFPHLGGQFNEQQKTWVFPGGAFLRFAYLKYDKDAEEYQGHSYTRVYVEEITNFKSPEVIDKLKATLRSSSGVKVGFRASGNPGGRGHTWVKRRYVDPYRLGNKVFIDPITKLDYVYIPSRLTDNKILTAQDPNYANRLRAIGNPNLIRAWLDGDWDVIFGAYFAEFSAEQHVLEPFQIPEHWYKFRSLDWGYAAPFSVGWWAVASEERIEGRTIIPRGALVRFQEIYGSDKSGQSLKLTTNELANYVKSKGFIGAPTICDPSVYVSNGGISIAETLYSAGLLPRKGDNKRIPGWQQLRTRLKGDNNIPDIFCFANCIDSIRTIPALEHDENNFEDVDSDGEDHAADEWRYACMSRPIIRPQPAKKTDWEKLLNKPITLGEMTEQMESSRGNYVRI